jgi:peptide/nickel transport system substrate-binding protein
MVPQGAENKAISEVVQAMAAEAGFDMKIRVTEFATSLKSAEAGEYQAYPDRLERPHRPGRQSLRLPRLQGAEQQRRICNPEVDKLLERGRAFSDPAKRKPIYEKVAKILLTERPHHLSLSPQGADRADHASSTASCRCPTAGARGGLRLK